MAYSEKGAAPGPGVEIDIGRVVRILFRKWWLIVALALAVAIAAAVFTEVTRKDTFTSTITFIVSNKAKGSGEGTDIISQSDLTASINMTNNFKYLLSGKAMYVSIVKSLKNKYKADEIGKFINVKTITDTSIIEMNVTSDSPEKSLEIAQAAVKNYKAVVEVYEGASIGVYAQPEKAARADSDTSAIRNAFIGAFVGAVLACIIIIVMNSSRNTVQSADEIRDLLDLTILGTVSQVGNPKKNKAANKQRQLLIVDKSSGFGFIETYKAIRTKIENAALKNGYKTFVISSAVEDEGKTTVATNIAIALALNGKSVLLIDADIRKPAVSKLLGLPTSKEKGLPDVISGAVSTEKAIKFVEKYKLFLLSGSYAASDPTELLSMPQTEKLIKDLENEFDFIIIDTSPAGVV
ncbi:MAG TPA: AAA family ATPase, partial [Clostridiales bacterium]|nr:AAA family ATPase [Clostridiales bacterium]